MLVAATLGGCSLLRLAYTQADAVVYWWLDGYVDFDGAQTLRARDGIAQWFAWHRTRQLPDYAVLLDRAAAEVVADATPEQACRWWDELRQRADIAVRQALPAAAPVAASLRPEQLERMARKQADVAVEWRKEFLQDEPAERLDASVKRAVERAEQLYGPLEAPQRARIAASVAASSFDPERWLAERQRRQRDLLDVLRALARADARPEAVEPAEKALRGVWQRWQLSPDEAYRRYAQALDRSNCELIARVHNSTTPKQREAAQRRLRGWQLDLRQLADAAG